MADATTTDPKTLVELVRDLQAHAKEQGWQDTDEPIAALLSVDLSAALLSAFQPSAHVDLQATRIREFAEMIERADCAGSIAVSMWFSQASDMLRGVADTLTRAEAQVTALRIDNAQWSEVHRKDNTEILETRDKLELMATRADRYLARAEAAEQELTALHAERDRLKAEAARLRAALASSGTVPESPKNGQD